MVTRSRRQFCVIAGLTGVNSTVRAQFASFQTVLTSVPFKGVDGTDLGGAFFELRWIGAIEDLNRHVNRTARVAFQVNQLSVANHRAFYRKLPAVLLWEQKPFAKAVERPRAAFVIGAAPKNFALHMRWRGQLSSIGDCELHRHLVAADARHKAECVWEHGNLDIGPARPIGCCSPCNWRCPCRSRRPRGKPRRRAGARGIFVFGFGE